MTQAGGSILVHLKRRARFMALLAVLALVPILAGCYGRFPLTKALYNYNGEISDREEVQTLVMWAFIIIPAYGGAMLGDAVIFNLVEYWTGERFDVGSVTTDDGIQVSMTPAADGAAMLTLSRDGVALAERQFQKSADGTFVVLDEQSRVVGKVIPAANGDLQFADANGTVLQVISPESLQKL